MRHDMPKIIVERARSGAGRLRNRAPASDADLVRSKIGVKRDASERGGHKRLNENLSPLRRFLAKQVGRPWNAVWAEICADLKISKAVHKHVRDHIPDFVGVQTTQEDGQIWVQSRWRRVPLKDSHFALFVDPRTGILRRNEHRLKRRAERESREAAEVVARAARMRVISAAKQLHLLNDGAWWEVTLAPIPTFARERKTPRGVQRYAVEVEVADVVLRARLSGLRREELYGARSVYAIAKRRLSKKAMRELNLR